MRKSVFHFTQSFARALRGKDLSCDRRKSRCAPRRASSFEHWPEQNSGRIPVRRHIFNHTMTRGVNHSCFIKISLFLAEVLRNFVRYHEDVRNTLDRAQTLNTCLQEMERLIY